MKASQLNRAQRRKAGIRVANNIIKSREQSVAKKQWGLGFIFTNLMGVITFGRRTYTLYDKRLS